MQWLPAIQITSELCKSEIILLNISFIMRFTQHLHYAQVSNSLIYYTIANSKMLADITIIEVT